MPPPNESGGRARARLLSVKQVAEELNVSIKTIRRQIASGAMIAHRIGRSIRVSADDLAAYRNRRRG